MCIIQNRVLRERKNEMKSKCKKKRKEKNKIYISVCIYILHPYIDFCVVYGYVCKTVDPECMLHAYGCSVGSVCDCVSACSLGSNIAKATNIWSELNAMCKNTERRSRHNFMYVRFSIRACVVACSPMENVTQPNEWLWHFFSVWITSTTVVYTSCHSVHALHYWNEFCPFFLDIFYSNDVNFVYYTIFIRDPITRWLLTITQITTLWLWASRICSDICSVF